VFVASVTASGRTFPIHAGAADGRAPGRQSPHALAAPSGKTFVAMRVSDLASHAQQHEAADVVEVRKALADFREIVADPRRSAVSEHC
jgi:hypothetical protein